MVRARTSRLASLAALVLAASLPACADQPDDDGPPDVTTGTYHAFIQHGWNFPATSQEWRALGFDFDHNGQLNNEAGALIGALGRIGLPIADANLEQLTRGDTIVAHVVRADGLERDDAVAWQLWTSSGAPPRYDGADVVDADRVDGALAGQIVAGTLRAEWGEAVIRVPLFPGQGPVALATTDARVELAVGAACHGRIGGLLDEADLATALEQIAQQTLAHMAAHPTHEFTQLARDVFDTDNDAVVSAAEVVAFAHMILRPDVDTDGDGARDAVSVAFGFDCAPAVVGVGPAF